jgi:hypothetical protein
MSVALRTMPGMETPHGASLADQLTLIPLRTDADVLARVDAIIDPASRADRTLWLFFLNPDGIQANVLMPIDDIPAYPGPDDAEGLFEMLGHLADPDGLNMSLVVTITRWGTTELTDSDRRWAAILRRGAAQAGTPVRMFCLATPEGVRGLGPARQPNSPVASD